MKDQLCKLIIILLGAHLHSAMTNVSWK